MSVEILGEVFFSTCPYNPIRNMAGSRQSSTEPHLNPLRVRMNFAAPRPCFKYGKSDRKVAYEPGGSDVVRELQNQVNQQCFRLDCRERY